GKPDYTYKIELHVYGACEINLPIGINQVVRYQSLNSGLPVETVQMDCISHVDGSIVAPGSGYIGENVHSLCPVFSGLNSCLNFNNQQFPGFRKWVYTKTITLPSAQTDWKFWFQGNARNGGIVNLLSPQGNFYIEAGINNFAKFNTNTPIFDAFPLPYICANVDELYLNGPIDIDDQKRGQYIRVTNQAPMRGENNFYEYAPPYSLNDPVNGGYSFNPVSGTATFRIPNTGFYVLAFRADKYSPEGELLSYTTRDVQITVMNCDKLSPVIDKVVTNLRNATFKPLTPTDSAIYVCPGSELSFEIFGYNFDPTKANKLYWSSNHKDVMPTSTFTGFDEGTDEIRGEFRWTPTADDIGDYTLIFSVNDSTCDTDL